jgi:hypothetical protein
MDVELSSAGFVVWMKKMNMWRVLEVKLYFRSELEVDLK